MLGVDSAVEFLAERGIVSREEILAGSLAVELVPHRHRILLVTTADGQGLFLKQSEDLARGGHRTLRREGEFYGRRRSSERELARSLPRLILYEPAVPVLVLERLAAHQTLPQYLRSFGPPGFPLHTWRELGRRLGRIHTELRPAESCRLAAGLSSPWVSRAHEPTPSALSKLSPAGLRVLEIVQGSRPIRNGLGSLDRLWKPETLIHGDIRGDNVLVGPGVGDAEDIRFVDWELHTHGDPAWDIAGFLALLVRYWLSGLLEGEGVPERPLLSSAVLQTAGRAFCEGYVAGAGPGGDWLPARATEVARFGAARIVQSAIETSARQSELPALAVLLLQVSENMFGDPTRASREFLAMS